MPSRSPLSSSPVSDANPAAASHVRMVADPNQDLPRPAPRKPLLNRIGAAISNAAAEAKRKIGNFFAAIGNFLNTKIWQPISNKLWGQAVPDDDTAEATAEERAPLLGRARKKVSAAAEHTQGIAYSFWLAISSVPGIIAESFKELSAWLSSVVFGKPNAVPAASLAGTTPTSDSTQALEVASPSTKPEGFRQRAGLQPVLPGATAAAAAAPSLQERADADATRQDGATSPGSVVMVNGPGSDVSSDEGQAPASPKAQARATSKPQ